MHLARIELTNFKNYEEVSLDFSPGFNCFVGNNGVGKTNILDAVHYLSLTKSFFNNSDSLSIRYGEDYFILKGLLRRMEVRMNFSALSRSRSRRSSSSTARNIQECRIM